MRGVICFCVCKIVSVKKCLCLAGNEVAACDYFYVGAVEIGNEVSLCDPAAANYTYAYFAVCVYDRVLFLFAEICA